MFTGIVENIGRVRSVDAAKASSRIVIATGYADLALGESVAVNGVCLTVIESNPKGDAAFFVSSETLDRSNLGKLAEGHGVNLERALQASARLSGHIVQGHVDGQGVFEGASPADGGSFDVRFRIPRALAKYCVEKGSISLNGVSLTINSLADDKDSSQVGIMLIPHTWSHTNLSELKASHTVNVEVDVLAKHVERLLACRN